MMRRKKMMLTCVVFLLAIGAITSIIIYNINEPKNVFEEIYYAEMDAAKSKKKTQTPLSNTAYFKETTAKIDFKERNPQTLSVKELPKNTSPYTLCVEDLTYLNTTSLFWMPGIKDYELLEKSVNITSKFVYHAVEFNIKYHYLLFSDGESDSYYAFPQEKGLYVSVTGSGKGRELITYEDFLAYGIEETELKDRIQEDIGHLLAYWVENYPNSKFSNDKVGGYEIINKKYFSKENRSEALLKRFKSG